MTKNILSVVFQALCPVPFWVPSQSLQQLNKLLVETNIIYLQDLETGSRK